MAKNKKKKFCGRYRKGMPLGRTTYKSKVVGLKNNSFDVGAASDPAKFSKLLKNIKSYIQKTHRSPGNMVEMLQQMKRVTLSYLTNPKTKKQDPQYCDEDKNPDPDAFDLAVFVWKEDNKSMKLRMDKYKDNKINAWVLIYNQFLPELRNTLKGMKGYNGAKSANNVTKLLTMIQGYCCQFDMVSNEYMVIIAAIKNLCYFLIIQFNADYHEDFMAMLEVIKEYRGVGSLTHFPNMLKQELNGKGTDLSKAIADKLKEHKKTICEKFLALLMLNGANGPKYNNSK